MPRQKPGKSETVVRTPPEFIKAAYHFLGVNGFDVDLAASRDNAVAPRYIAEKQDALTNQDWHALIPSNGWAWLNPPYSDIRPWVRKAAEEKLYLPNYSGIAVLVPASTGSNWWRDYVHEEADIQLLNGRIQFVGHTSPYPKDLALLLYSLTRKPGYHIWSWKS